MKTPIVFRIVCAAAAGILLLTRPAARDPRREESILDLRALLPETIDENADAGALYDRETIFRYMNGAAEIYLSYDFRALLVQRVPGPAEDTISIELYDMGSSAEAFGVFSRNRSGEEAGIGQGSEYRSGYLLFWRNRLFATIWTDREGPASHEAVFEIGKAIAARAAEDGPLPDLLSRLPESGLDSGSIRYFHKHTDLNQHYFVSDENILGLGEQTDAAMAEYAAGNGGLLLLVVRYPGEAEAAFAREQFIEHFLPESHRNEVAAIEDGSFAGSAREGRYLVAVFDAPDAASAKEHLAAARSLLEEREK
ncbi:MAG: hypothetical protein FJY73_06270 [Candidatus Eisenbacteria bacterium]|nr:hypothetical protein [Candidatus Eisenbacteria bacterium]